MLHLASHSRSVITRWADPSILSTSMLRNSPMSSFSRASGSVPKVMENPGVVPSATTRVAPPLADLKPKGVIVAAGLLVAASFIWTAMGIIALIKFISSPKNFLHKKDRNSLKLAEPMEGLQHEMLNVNGIKIHAVSPGRQPGKPLLLFLHGFPESWYTWKNQMKEFRADYDVVAVDMRGYGESDKPQGVSNYTVDKLASDVPRIVTALGHSKCTLVAHDWGGVVAWFVAAIYPQLLDRLVVLSAPHPGLYQANMTRSQALKSWYILYFQAPWLPETLSACSDAEFVEFQYKAGTLMGCQKDGVISELDVEWIKQAVQRPGALTAMINYYRALFLSLTLQPDPKVWDVMRSRISTPTLLLWGEKDGALDFDMNTNIEQVVDNIEVHNLKGTSHWIPVEEPEKVNQLIRAFLDKPAA